MQFLEIYLYFSANAFDLGSIICILVCMKACKAGQVFKMCICILWNPVYASIFVRIQILFKF